MTTSYASPRPVIRGESLPKQQARVDWLNVTFLPNEITQAQVIFQLSEIMRRPVSGLDEGKGIRGYASSVALFAHVGSRKQAMGFLGYGGEAQRGTWMLSISGVGCALIDAWCKMRRWLESLKAKITRLDLCVDFLYGEYTVDDAVSFYESGRFNCSGRQPSTDCAGDWLNGKSRTLYVGKAKNGKLLRAYEKGHQLGHVDSPWTRYEVQFGSRDRVIPLEALTERDKYFAGAYPALADLLDNECGAKKIPTTRTEGEVTLSHLLTHLRRTYGKAIDAMSATEGFEIASLVEEVRVFGIPRRVNISALASGPNWSGVCDLSKQERKHVS
jgi:phage replication initiation protein